MAMSPQTLLPKPSGSNAIKTPDGSNAIKTHDGGRVLTHDSRAIGA